MSIFIRKRAPGGAEVPLPPVPPPEPPVTGRVCVTCAVTWRSADEACWCCGRPGQPAINVNVW